MPNRPSWTASISAGLGLLSLAAVLCFHFPELLTSRELRAVYTEQFARTLLLAGLVASFVLGTLAIVRGRQRRTALVGVASATLAVALGGTGVGFGPIRPTPWSLGLDWFVLSLLLTALVFVPLERLFAQRPQSPLRPGWRTDLAYFFMTHVGVQFVLLFATATTTTVAAHATWPPLRDAIRALPAWVQFPLAVIAADLAQSLLHRAYHRVPWLWRLHRVHHSSEHIDWLAGSRMHALEVLATRSLVLLPIVLLGFATPVVEAYVVLVGLQAVLAHANVDLRAGWLERWIVLPRYHHWHHARDPAYADRNYAIHTPWIDRLFGTYALPDAPRWPDDYGLQSPREVPAGFWAQLASPFVRTPRDPER
jgi:sterol desaturase/sphingolipid hydroxylase (fatty acid hydroxylase superfamily)